MNLNFLFQFFLIANLIGESVLASEIKDGGEPGSIIFGKKTYKNVTGEKDGFSRHLTSINGKPALHASSAKDGLYYSLQTTGGSLVIDCAYIDKRNIYNGARVSAGVCSLNTPLTPDYATIGQDYSSEWIGRIFSFNTRPVFETNQSFSFLLGKVGEIEVFNKYSPASLDSSDPETYIRGTKGCHSFGNAEAFLVFLRDDKNHPRYLDVVLSYEPMKLERLGEDKLREIAVNKCQ